MDIERTETESYAREFVAAGIIGMLVAGGLVLTQANAFDPSPTLIALGYLIGAVAWAFLNAGLIGYAVRGRPSSNLALTADQEQLTELWKQYQAGALTQAQYEEARQDILDDDTPSG